MNDKRILKKMLVIGIISFLIGVSISPVISGINQNSKKVLIDIENQNQDVISLTLYSFDRSGSKKYSSVHSNDVVLEISERIEELGKRIVNDPHSDETQSLKIEFVKLLGEQGLIPDDMTDKDFSSLLNPTWLKTINRIGRTQKLFNPDIKDLSKQSSSPSSAQASLFLCSLSSFGKGIAIPLFILPRPRVFSAWIGSENSGTTVGSLLPGRGFSAGGQQFGITLGFLGIGIAYSAFGVNFYGFIGYSIFVYVNANDIKWYTPS